MFTAEIGEFWVSSALDGLPAAYDIYRERAVLREEINLDDADAGRQWFLHGAMR